MSQTTARPWSGPAGTRATAAAAATVAAAVFTVPAAHTVISAVEDHSAAVPFSAAATDFSPVVHNVIPVALASIPQPRVSGETLSAVASSGTSAGRPTVISGVIGQADVAESIRRLLAGTSFAEAQPHKIVEMLRAPVPAAAAAASGVAAAAPGVAGVAPGVAGVAASGIAAAAPGAGAQSATGAGAQSATGAGAQTAGLVMPPVPSKGSAALSAAMGAMGTPYRWGGTGRGGFDCSGLAQWAYRKAGITLPRSSRAQSGVGTPVSRADLRPGDLVFFYRPVSHVGIYVGNGNVVHAPQTGDVVKISPISRMPFAGARRL